MTWLWETWDWLRYRSADLRDFFRDNRGQLRALLVPGLIALFLVWWFWEPPQYIGPDPEDASGVVILLHGYGTSGSEIAGLAERISTEAPEISLIMPDAPYGAGLGHAWHPSFSVPTKAEVKPKQDEHRAQSRAVVMDIIEDLKNDGVPLERIYVGGFSQGGTVAVDVFANEEAAQGLGGVLSLSGGSLAVPLDRLAELPVARFLITHGTKDRVVGSTRSKHVATVAEESGHTVRFLAFEGGHEVTPEVLAEIVSFLRES